jgi:hypothetical protein
MNRDRIQIGLFVLILTLPGLLLLASGKGAVPAHEFRSPASCPSLKLLRNPARFTAKFEAFFNDHLGFRAEVLQLYRAAKVQLLGRSPSPRLIVGRDGWLFWKPERDRPATPMKQWSQLLLQRQHELSERGILYLVAIAPDKQSIYREMLPAESRNYGESVAMTELLNSARESNLNLLDLRPKLREAAKSQSLYLKEDTHWHDEGAWIASEEIFAVIRQTCPTLEPLNRERFVRSELPAAGPWDLGRQLHPEASSNEPYLQLKRIHPKSSETRPLELSTEAKLLLQHLKPPVVSTRLNSDSTGPRLLFLHDSFGSMCVPLWEESFREFTALPTYALPRETIQRLQPEVVVQLFVERMLLQPIEEVLGRN